MGVSTQAPPPTMKSYLHFCIDKLARNNSCWRVSLILVLLVSMEKICGPIVSGIYNMFTAVTMDLFVPLGLGGFLWLIPDIDDSGIIEIFIYVMVCSVCCLSNAIRCILYNMSSWKNNLIAIVLPLLELQNLEWGIPHVAECIIYCFKCST